MADNDHSVKLPDREDDLRFFERPAWHAEAACRGLHAEGGPNTFFPEGKNMAAVREHRAARAICDSCPVTEQCAAAGLGEYYGIWGGLSEKQRRNVRRGRPPGRTDGGSRYRLQEREP